MFGTVASFIIIPFSWLLRMLYNVSMSYGVAIILFSLVVKLILLPFSFKMKRNTMGMSRLAPRVKELEKKYKTDQQRYADEVKKLYDKEHVNPLSGCLWGFIPLPIMIALYTVIRKPLTNFMSLTAAQITTVSATLTALGVDLTAKNSAYSEINIAQKIFEHFDEVKAVVPEIFRLDFSFLGLNLAQIPTWSWFLNGDYSWSAIGLFLIPIVSGVLALFSSMLTMTTNTSMNQMPGTSKSMMYAMPLISVWMGFVLPASLGIYWISNSLFTMIQEYMLNKHFKKKFAEADAIREVEEAEERAKEAEKLAAQALMRKEENKNTSKNKKKRQTKDTQKGATTEQGRVDDRPYARGRAFVEERYPLDTDEEIEIAPIGAVALSAVESDESAIAMDSDMDDNIDEDEAEEYDNSAEGIEEDEE